MFSCKWPLMSNHCDLSSSRDNNHVIDTDPKVKWTENSKFVEQITLPSALSKTVNSVTFLYYMWVLNLLSHTAWSYYPVVLGIQMLCLMRKPHSIVQPLLTQNFNWCKIKILKFYSENTNSNTKYFSPLFSWCFPFTSLFQRK